MLLLLERPLLLVIFLVMVLLMPLLIVIFLFHVGLLTIIGKMTVFATIITFLLDGIFDLPCAKLVSLGIKVVSLLVQS